MLKVLLFIYFRRHEVLADFCHNHKFMMFVLLISVGDALLVATELTLDILAIKIRKLS